MKPIAMLTVCLLMLMGPNGNAGIGGSYGGTTGLKLAKMYVQSPSLFFKAGDITVSIPVLKLCINQDKVQTIEDYEIMKITNKEELSVVGVDKLQRDLVSSGKSLDQDYEIQFLKKIKDRENIYKTEIFNLPDCQ